MAIGAMRAIREAGLRIPEDISVIGFDGIPESEFTTPTLTTIQQPIYEKGRKAAQLLIDMLEDKAAASVKMPVELKQRGSTAPNK
jgi:LacI family transcriptional regulator